MARQEVYRVLSDLEEKGLIEKTIARPSMFKPISAQEAVAILFQDRRKHSEQLRKKAIKQFSNFAMNRVEAPPLNSNAQFFMLSKSETDPTGPIDRIGRAIEEAQKSVMCSVTFSVFTKVKLIDEHIWKKAATRGVRFRFIIGRGVNADENFTLDPTLENDDRFEVRWTNNVVPATVLLIDEREVFCRTGRGLECPVLWSRNSFFIAVIRDYFEMKWKSLKRLSKKEVLSTV